MLGSSSGSEKKVSGSQKIESLMGDMGAEVRIIGFGASELRNLRLLGFQIATYTEQACSASLPAHACMTQAQMASQLWRDAQSSLLNLEKANVASVDFIVRSGMETNQLLRSKLSSAVPTVQGDVDVANKNLINSIGCSLKLDHDACANMDSVSVPSRKELREMKSGHYHKIVEITENAGKCLEEECVVDEPSCSTPRKRSIILPSVASIEELRTPSFEELSKSFWEGRSVSRQSNGDVKHLSAAYKSPQSQNFRDSRVLLTALN